MDSSDDAYSFGNEVPDSFGLHNYNIVFKPNRVKDPDCLFDISLKVLKAGDKLYAERGKAYWCHKTCFETLSTANKKEYKKHNNIDSRELF